MFFSVAAHFWCDYRKAPGFDLGSLRFLYRWASQTPKISVKLKKSPMLPTNRSTSPAYCSMMCEHEVQDVNGFWLKQLAGQVPLGST